MSIQGYKSLIKEESSLIGFTDEATTTSDDTSYQITDTAKRIWGFNSNIIVEDAGVPTVEKYTLSRLTGVVTFESANPARVITITGDYVVLTTTAEAKEWAIDFTADMLDVTVFQDSSREFKPGLKSASASIGKFYTIDKYFMDMILNGTTKVIEFYADAAAPPIRVYALVASDNISDPVEGIIEESIDLQITDRMIVEV